MSKVKRSTTKVSKPIAKDPFSDYWTKTNIILTAVSIVVITFGFILMTKGPWDNPLSLTLSPIVLIIAYFVLIPASILFFGKKKTNSEPEKTAE